MTLPKKKYSDSTVKNNQNIKTNFGFNVSLEDSKKVKSNSDVSYFHFQEEINEIELLFKQSDSMLISFIKTQKGSRQMQGYLELEAKTEIISELLCKMYHSFKEIMNDPYANYFINKLIISCNSQQRIFIIKNKH